MKKKIFRALYSAAEKVLSNEEKKKLDKEIDAKISNIVENYVSHYIYMSKATYENLFGEKYNTNVIFLKNVDLTEAEEDELITNLMSKEGVS